MSGKEKSYKVPPKDLILKLLNNDPGCAEEILQFYERYIHACSYMLTCTDDAQQAYLCEDLEQEIFCQMLMAIRSIRKKILLMKMEESEEEEKFILF